VYLKPILGKLGVTHDLGWWRIGKADGRLSIRINWTFSPSRLLWFWSYEAKSLQLGCFRKGVDLFAFKFYLDRVVPVNHSWHQKTRHWATRWWRPHPSVFSHFDTILECDGWTDERIDGRTNMP